jgi:hypothetical protein
MPAPPRDRRTVLPRVGEPRIRRARGVFEEPRRVRALLPGACRRSARPPMSMPGGESPAQKARGGRGLWVRGLVGGGRSPWVYARLSDGELLGLVSGRRDEAAFAEFFGRKARPVYSLILRRCRMRWRWRSWRASGCIRRWSGCLVVSARSSSGRISVACRRARSLSIWRSHWAPSRPETAAPFATWQIFSETRHHMTDDRHLRSSPVGGPHADARLDV